MRTIVLALSTLAVLSASPAIAQQPARAAASGTEEQAHAPAPSAAAATSVVPAIPEALRLHAAYDLGVLSFGGIGVHAGLAKGPWTGALGFYRFESKNMFGGALGGFGDDFEFQVDFIAAAQVGYFFNGETNEGFYGKFIYQAKQQTVTHKASGHDAVLTSHLLGPEVGYEWDILGGLFLRPRLGALFYVKSPQPGREPVQIGGAQYDNPTHNWVDAYVTADLGFEFDL